MRRTLVRAALVFTVLVSLTGLARAQGVELVSKQRLLDTLEDPAELRVFRIMAVEGDLLTVKVMPVKKTGLVPVFDLLGPDGRVALPAPKQGRLKAGKVPLGATGMYLLTVRGAGTTGDFKLAMTLKSAKIAPATVTVPGELPVTVPRNALLSIKATAVKASGVEPGVDAVIDPGDRDVLDDDLLVERGGKARLKNQVCPTFGPHTIRLADRAGVGGDVTVRIKVKPAKPRIRVMAPDDLVNSGFLKIRSGDGRFQFLAWADDGIEGASLRFSNDTSVDLPEVGGGEYELRGEYESEAELDAAAPDGVSTIDAVRRDGPAGEFQLHVRGGWPGELEVTDEGQGDTPTITWDLGAGEPVQVFYLVLKEEGADDPLYEVLLPGADRSHTVPAGFVSGEDWVVELWAVTPGLKVSVPGEPIEADGWVALVTHSWGQGVDLPLNRHHVLHASVRGPVLRSVGLRLPGGGTLALASDAGEWTLMERSATPYADGTYTFVIELDDLTVDESRSFTVGGSFPAFSDELWPYDGTGDFGTTPEIRWGTIAGGSGYRLEVEDADGLTVIDWETDQPLVGTYQVQAGMLTADRWYLATISAENGQGKRSQLYSAIYTGTLGDLWWGVEKVRIRRASGGAPTEYALEVNVSTDQATSATLVRPDGTAYPLPQEAPDYFSDYPEYADEASLDAAFGDGLYTLRLVMKNGAVCPFLHRYVGGDWADYPTVVSPADGATGVSRTPTVSWSYSDATVVAAVAGPDLQSEARDEDYAETVVLGASTTSVAWNDFEERYVPQLPSSSLIDLKIGALNFQGRKSNIVTSFTTEP